MTLTHVLDTTVLIDVLRRHPGAVAFLREAVEPPVASEVSRVEVLRGLRSSERAGAEHLFQLMRWAPVDEPIARVAGELGRRYRRSHAGVEVSDLIVAATAQQFDLPLATANAKHYPMFRGLRPPY